MGHDKKYREGVSLSYRIAIWLDSVIAEDNQFSRGLYMEHGSELRVDVASIRL